MVRPLLHKAVAVWLIRNTALTFEQIAAFCQLHILEVKAMADGEASSHIRPVNPVDLGELTTAEIERCVQDSSAQLRLTTHPELAKISGKGKYTPLARRRNKPNAILWLIRNYPELTDAQIIKLIQTTKNSIRSIRERTHWNYANLKAKDPVLLGLCSQTELSYAIGVAKKKVGQQGVQAV